MRAPWTLRWALAWAIIRHEFVAISVDFLTEARYVFEVRPQSVRRWLQRSERIRTKLNSARFQERERLISRLRVIHSTAVLDPDGAIKALGELIATEDQGV